MRFLSDKTVEKAYNYALEVLAKVGIIFEKEEALDVFRNRGFKVEANKVFMNSKQIELALETLPKAAPEEDKGGSAVATSPFGNSPLILDHRTGEIRRGTLTDAINVYKLTETSPLYECSNPAVVDPEGLEAEDGFVAQVALLLKHTDKFPSLGIRATKATS
ncbi:MAG: trimethylamine methyltransferase family protein, partial [Anaerovoracaceae bacterium]